MAPPPFFFFIRGRVLAQADFSEAEAAKVPGAEEEVQAGFGQVQGEGQAEEEAIKLLRR